MEKIFRIYRLLNVLSVDVAAGAVASAFFFTRIFEVSVLSYGFISLGLTVWIIYTADHLLDAYNVAQPASSERHRFHQQHFKMLLSLLLTVTVFDVLLLFFIRKTVFIEGVWLACVVGMYFLTQRYLKFFKEMIGAVLYSGGVLLIPVSLNSEKLDLTRLLLTGQFALTALINLLLFSWFDRQQDEIDRHPSFATAMGDNATKTSLKTLFFVQGILICVQLSFRNLGPAAVFATMNTALLLIFLKRSYFQEKDRYRLLGDAVFLFPLVYVAMT